VSEPGTPRRTWVQVILVCVFIGTTQMTWGVVVPALPLYASTFDASPALLGVIVAAFSVGRLMVNIPAGLLVQRVAPRPLLVGVGLALAALTSVTGLIDSLPVLLAARVLAGILGGAAVTIGMTVLTEWAPESQRGRVLATAQAVQIGGAAAGPVLGGFTLVLSNITVTFVVAAVPVLLCVVAVLLVRSPAFWSGLRPGPSIVPQGATRPVAAPAGFALAFAGLNVVGFAIFFTRFGGDQSLIPLLAYDIGGLNPASFGLVAGVATALSLLVLPVVARLLDRGWRLKLMIPTMVTASAVMLFYPTATNPVLFAAVMLVTTVLNGVGTLVPSVILADITPRGRVGFAVGVSRTVGDLGATIGPIALGLAMSAGGAVPAVLLLSASSVIAIVIYLALARVAATRANAAELVQQPRGTLPA